MSFSKGAAFIAAFLCSLALTNAVISSDEITHLPGWEGPLPSRMYSGYIPVGETSGVKGHIHYWFIESQGNPRTDPVVYWTNGGPGGSGINAGLLTEMGAIHLNDASFGGENSTDGVPKLFYNKFAWSTKANMIYVSQPKGVGFSYCDDVTDAGCVNNDLTAAEDAYDFFKNFFNSYPEFAQNDFYLTAESYGGIYIPMFMDQMDRRGGFPQLKGAAIGDGCWGTSVGMCNFTTGVSQRISAEFYHGHAMYSQSLYAEIEKACGAFSDKEVKAPACKKALDAMNDEIGSFDIYNIYDTCAGDTFMTYKDMVRKMSSHSVEVSNPASAARHPQLSGSKVSGALNDYPCGGSAATEAWLQLPEVAEALHVKTGKSGMKYNWGPYSISGDLRPLYHRLVQKYHMLIYSGDTDACVPFVGTEEWTRELGFKVKEAWKPWHSQHMDRKTMQRAGYSIKYDVGGEGQFTFATVQGAGHMVPTYKPHFALTLLEKFLSGEF